jgi:type IV secretory pathway TrbL component
MNEETQITTRTTDQTPQDSQLVGVSVRAWLAILLTITVCVMALLTLKVEEPLYTLATIALGFYFGQKNK